MIGREILENYFRTSEANPAVNTIPDRHRVGIDFLYER